MTGRAESERDCSQTPWWLVRQLEALTGYTFMLDVAARFATKKAPYYYGFDREEAPVLADDCLKADWGKDLAYAAKDFRFSQNLIIPACFINPPFSKPTRYMAAVAHWSAQGVPVVGVVKDDRSTRWYRKYIRETATYILEPDGRVAFLQADGTPFLSTKGEETSADFPVICPVWTKIRPAGPAQIIPFALPSKEQRLCSTQHHVKEAA